MVDCGYPLQGSFAGCSFVSPVIAPHKMGHAAETDLEEDQPADLPLFGSPPS